MRRALIGLVMAATALTPIASAYAQDGSRWRRDVQQQSQTSGASGDVQRSWQRYERKAEQFQQQNQGGETQRQSSESRPQRFERTAPQVQQPPQQVQTQQGNRERWSQQNGTDGGRRFERRQAPQLEQTQQQVQTQQWNQRRWQSDRNRTGTTNTYERRNRDGNHAPDGTRNWDGTRASGETRTWSGNRTTDGSRSWDGNRTWDRNRSGSWSGRTYSWNRDGRTYNWNHDWRNNQRYDWQGYRRSNRFVFNIGSYYAPYRNYSYRRFSIGYFLEPLFFSSNYWIGDPWYYRLPPAPPGTRWIRYYDDVLLVDRYTGEVIDVIYDFFW